MAEGRDADLLHRLHQILAPFVLRRKKDDVHLDLPAKRHLVIECPLNAKQLDLYQRFLSKSLNSEMTKMSSHNVLMQLRKVCNHPQLFGLPRSASAKLQVLVQILKHAPGNSAFLVFSQMTRMLDIIGEALRDNRIEFCRLDGSTDRRERLHQVFLSQSQQSS